MFKLNLAPSGVYRATIVTNRPVGSCPTFPPLPKIWKSISVALSLESPPPAVNWHPVLLELGLSSLCP